MSEENQKIEGDVGGAKANPSGPGPSEGTGSSKAAEKVNPSAPGETGTTPGTNQKQA